MKADNDNDQAFQRDTLDDVYSTHGEALLGALYAGKLLQLRQQVAKDCQAHGTALEALEAIYASHDEGPDRAYLTKIFHGDDDKIDAFETLCIFRNDIANFWDAITCVYLENGANTAKNDLQYFRAVVAEDLETLGGIGPHETRELMSRVEKQLHKAITATLPFYGRQI